jgi:hypothetical protein
MLFCCMTALAINGKLTYANCNSRVEESILILIILTYSHLHSCTFDNTIYFLTNNGRYEQPRLKDGRGRGCH